METTVWRGRWIAALLSCSVAGACSLDFLYGVDSARPSLQSGDTFNVDPICLDLPVDSSAVADVSREITMTGRRGSSGAGAESVPVSVRIGSCDAPAADRVDASLVSSSGLACTGSAPRLELSEASAFELEALEGRGCRRQSPSRMDCTLDARGEAAFGVIGHPGDHELTLGGYLPLCITPVELEGQLDAAAPRDHEVQAAVIPHVGSRIALAVAALDGSDPEQGDQCEALVSCEAIQARGRFLAGVVSPDISAQAVGKSDFRAVRRDVALSATLRTLSAPASAADAYLSTDSGCAKPAGAEAGASDGSGGLELHIAAGQTSTQVFYLCAPGFASQHEITPGLLDASGEQPQIRSLEPVLDSLTKALVVKSDGGQLVLFAETCDGDSDPVVPGALEGIAPPLIGSTDGKRVLVDCSAGASDAGNPDASVEGGTSQDAGADAGGCTAAVKRAAGGTCSLIVDG